MYFQGDGALNNLEFSKYGKLLLTGHKHGMLKLWDATRGKWLRNFMDQSIVPGPGSRRNVKSHPGIQHAVFSPDGAIVASSSLNELKLWDSATGALRKSMVVNVDRFDNQPQFGKLSFSSTGTLLACGTTIWDVSSFKIRAQLDKKFDHGGGVVFSPDGRYIAGCGNQVALFEPDPYDGLYVGSSVSREEASWFAQAMARMGYLNAESGIQTAVYRDESVNHIAITLPEGAPTDEVIVASLRDEIGPILAERLGPKLAIHLCGEDFQIQRTIDVERPAAAAVVEEPNETPTVFASSPSVARSAVEPAQPNPDLRGAWRVEKKEIDARTAKFDTTTIYRFEEEQLVIEAKNTPSADMSYSVDSTTSPHRLDVVLHRPEGDAVSQMIYRIEGDVLTVCYPPAGEPRPSDFTPQAGAKHTVIEFRRVTGNTPARTTSAPVTLGTRGLQ